MTALIFQKPKSAMQSGRKHEEEWRLEFAPAEPKRPDPLTGWAGSGDTMRQVELDFPSRDAAIAYADKKGWPYRIVPTPARRLKLQAYADNFR